MKTRIFLDLELTTPNDGFTPEIIQIGAVKVTDTIETFNQYVQPSVRPVINGFCERLTGITQAMINEADSFLTVLAELIAFCEGGDIYVWGEDQKRLNENCRLNDVENPLHFINAQSLLKQQYGLKGVWKLKKYLSSLKVDVPYTHDALDDAYALYHFLNARHFDFSDKRHERTVYLLVEPDGDFVYLTYLIQAEDDLPLFSETVRTKTTNSPAIARFLKPFRKDFAQNRLKYLSAYSESCIEAWFWRRYV